MKSWLSKKSLKEMTKAERKEMESKWTTVVLRQGQALWIPTGLLHAACPLSMKRESLVKVEATPEKKKNGKKKKDEDATEYVSMIYIPVLQDADNSLAPLTVCKCVGRWTEHKTYGPPSWEKNADWKEYFKALQEISDTTAAKKDGDRDDQWAAKAASASTATAAGAV